MRELSCKGILRLQRGGRMTCKLSDKCDNVFACNILRPNVELLGCNFYRPKKPMTNEEHLKSCNTEQLAEAIYYLTWFHTELDERLDKNVKNGCYNDDENIKIVMEWLKQPHTKKE